MISNAESCPTARCLWHDADSKARCMLRATPCHADVEAAPLACIEVGPLPAGIVWFGFALESGYDIKSFNVFLGQDPIPEERLVRSAGRGISLVAWVREPGTLKIVAPSQEWPAQIESFTARVPEHSVRWLEGSASDGMGITTAAILLDAVTNPHDVDFSVLDDVGQDAALAVLALAAGITRKLGIADAEVTLRMERARQQPTAQSWLQVSQALVRAHRYREAEVACDRMDDSAGDFDGDTRVRVRDDISGYRRIGRELSAIRPAKRLSAQNAGTVAYCLHNALPHMNGGYAARSHGLARALSYGGHPIIALVRPGFPSDNPAADAEDVRDRVIDGVEYRFNTGFGRRGRLYGYLAEAADYYESQFRQLDIEVVHAATNYLTALPAGLAAHRLGLPFVYEVRSFWNLSREAKSPGAATGREARRDDRLETITLALASRIVTLTEAMKTHLAGFGIAGHDIDIVPNCVDPDLWAPRQKQRAVMAEYDIRPDDVVIGYAGAMLGYEGLGMLVDATASIAGRFPRLKLLLVGADPANCERAGTVEHELVQKMKASGLAGMLAPRVSHDRIAEVQALFDIAVFPRLPLPVCELISPLKPLEAMALGKAVIVSSVGGMKDMITDRRTGLVFEKGSTSDLARALAAAMEDKALRQSLGSAAQNYVREERNWITAARSMELSYRRATVDPRPGIRKMLDEAVSQHFDIPPE